MAQYPLLSALEPVRHATPERPAASAVYTVDSFKDGALSLPGISTLYDVFRQSSKTHANSPCLGYRRVVNGEAQPYEFMTYNEVGNRVDAVGAAFHGIGLKAKERVSVLGANCPEWMLAMQGCNRMNLVCVPLYETLGENAIEFILEHSEARVVVVAGKRLGRVARALAAIRSQLLAVVYWGDALPGDVEAAHRTGVRVFTFSEFEASGRAAPRPPQPPSAEDLSTVMYTSGTTGDPKGVMITHHAVVAAIRSCNSFLEQQGEDLDVNDCYLSFLPLAHIFDRVVEEFVLYRGGCIGYWQGDIAKVLDDIMALRPTFFAGVPRVFERIYAGVQEQLARSSLRRSVFNYMLQRKARNMALGARFDQASWLADALVFRKVKQRMGGRVRLFLSGAAPLSRQVEEFLSVAMCAPVLQGYGLTESCAASFIALPFRWDMLGTVGPPLPGVQLRLEAVPDMGYDPLGTPPRGEVCLRGEGLFSGYYKAPEMTADAIDADGFYHTGDVGELVGDGVLRIIDRKKNIFKLSQGEYVAVEKVEAVLKNIPLVEQIWVYGNSLESCLVAVVVPAEKALLSWASAAAAAGAQLPGSYEELCREPAAAGAVLEALTEAGREGRLRGFEIVKAVHLDSEQFSVDNDLMTPTFKLKRAPLQRHYQAVLDGLYAQLRSGGGSKA